MWRVGSWAAPEQVLLPELACRIVFKPVSIRAFVVPENLRPPVPQLQNENFVQIELINHQGRLGCHNDLTFLRENFDHASDQGDCGRMQSQFRFVQKHDIREQLWREVQQRHQREQAKRAVGGQVRTDRLVHPPRLPPKHDLPVFFYELESVEDRENALDMAANSREPARVLCLEVEQDRGQVPAIRPKRGAVRRVPFLFEPRMERCVVELVYGAAAQQIAKHSCRCRIVWIGRLHLFRDFRLEMAAADLRPTRLPAKTLAARSKRLLYKNKTILGRVFERESVLVPPFVGPHGQFGFHCFADIAAAEQLVGGSAPQLDEHVQLMIIDHRVHHLNEAKQVRFSRTVRPDQHGGLRDVVDLDVGERPKSFDVKGLDQVRHDPRSFVSMDCPSSNPPSSSFRLRHCGSAWLLCIGARTECEACLPRCDFG